MGYKSETTLGTPTAKERVTENNRIMESATGVAFGSVGTGFANEDLYKEEDNKVIDENDDDANCKCGAKKAKDSNYCSRYCEEKAKEIKK